MVIVFYSLSDIWIIVMIEFRQRNHEAAMEVVTLLCLLGKARHKKSWSALANTARNMIAGGDNDGHYHIYFTAYVDHNREEANG